MRVGICDDDNKWYQKAKEIIESYGKKTDIEIEVLYFPQGESLEAYEGDPLEAVFMDVDLGKESGIILAGKINKKWKNCQIIYLTNYLSYATETYHTTHTFFVLKEQFQERIGEVFGKIFHIMEQKSERLAFSVIGGKEVVLAPEDILYFERSGRTTRIVTLWGNYEIWDKLQDVMEKLPELDFVRCHNSYIVYMPAVREMGKGCFILKNGTKIMISRSHTKAVKTAFMRWAMTQML
ncbi:MAG TPA: LytTR family DNA-binding domain-containing protein [Candidatus Blautia merdigallinarum]|uniref:LytTR family DNA-binding domain-containing protein n=1 Tax=Candidatus Blautia merdigallinarum TaxID=2838495 RepID=A0A9D2N6J3_9FIRM|nr:LytTR family DNA-binding domain-containing protein [Candidatus Blautia merdigallinarum]